MLSTTYYGKIGVVCIISVIDEPIKNGTKGIPKINEESKRRTDHFIFNRTI